MKGYVVSLIAELESAPEPCKFNMVACKSDIKHKFIAVQIPVHMCVRATLLTQGE
jgi:hypothetical protein